jgi:predicted PurR-regulated permease PerM
MDKKINVSITPGSVLTILLIAAGAYAFWILRGLALLVLTSIVIASAVEPGITFFRRFRVPRVLAVTIMYLLVFGSFFGIIYFFLPPILNDAQNLISTVPQYLNTLNIPSALGGISLGSAAATTHQAQSLFSTLLEFRSAFSADTSEGAFRLISTFFGGIFSLIIVVVLSFYFAIQETGVEDFLRLVSPAQHEKYIIDLWKRAQKKIGQWMQGQILLSLLVAITIYLGLLILRIPDALLIAVFTALAEIIPIFGSFIAGIPAVLIAYTTVGLAPALFVAGLFIVVNQFEGTLIHPLIVKKVVGVPPLLVLIAIIAGGDLAGFLGVVLAVPLAAILREALSDFEKRKNRLATTSTSKSSAKASAS